MPQVRFYGKQKLSQKTGSKWAGQNRNSHKKLKYFWVFFSAFGYSIFFLRYLTSYFSQKTGSKWAGQNRNSHKKLKYSGYSLVFLGIFFLRYLISYFRTFEKFSSFGNRTLDGFS